MPIISGREGDRIKIEVTIDLSGSMLEAEEFILRGVNAVGNVVTGEALKRFVLDEETTNWRAVCGKTARTVRRAGSAKADPDPYHTAETRLRG